MSDVTETIARAVIDRLEAFDVHSIPAAIITALEAAGYAIVPIEPTEAMISAGIIERHDQPTPEAWSLATANIYRAMINAGKAKA